MFQEDHSVLAHSRADPYLEIFIGSVNLSKLEKSIVETNYFDKGMCSRSSNITRHYIHHACWFFFLHCATNDCDQLRSGMKAASAAEIRCLLACWANKHYY